MCTYACFACVRVRGVASVCMCVYVRDREGERKRGRECVLWGVRQSCEGEESRHRSCVYPA